MTASGDPDGSTLLTSAEVNELLSAAVEHAGGSLVSWRLDHVDANPTAFDHRDVLRSG